MQWGASAARAMPPRGWFGEVWSTPSTPLLHVCSLAGPGDSAGWAVGTHLPPVPGQGCCRWAETDALRMGTGDREAMAEGDPRARSVLGTK